MISDEECREVARKLRETKRDCDQRESPWMVEDLMQAIGFGSYEDGEEHIFDRLADLIDRPTCNDVYIPRGDGFTPYITFKCSVCGETHVSLTYCNYCPNCGAEVRDE